MFVCVPSCVRAYVCVCECVREGGRERERELGEEYAWEREVGSLDACGLFVPCVPVICLYF